MVRYCRCVLAAGILAAASTTTAGPIIDEVGPDLVTNGGFEATSTLAGSGWTVTGFIAEGFDYLIDSAPADAHSGTRSFAGGGIGAPGFISQNIATVPGQAYNIHLWLANLSGFASGTEVQVLWGGNLVYSATDILGFGYTQIVIDPVATSATTALSIGLRDDSFFLNVDDVSVRQVGEGTAPEPATLALLGIGLAGLGFSRRQRQWIEETIDDCFVDHACNGRGHCLAAFRSHGSRKAGRSKVPSHSAHSQSVRRHHDHQAGRGLILPFAR